MPLHYSLADCQSNSCAAILVMPVQSLEDFEDPVKILRIDPNSLVSHGEYLGIMLFFA